MDLVVYIGILLVIGFIRVNKTQNISEDIGIVDTGATVSRFSDDIPLASNLQLEKEPGAYTLILEELGLLQGR